MGGDSSAPPSSRLNFLVPPLPFPSILHVVTYYYYYYLSLTHTLSFFLCRAPPVTLFPIPLPPWLWDSSPKISSTPDRNSHNKISSTRTEHRLSVFLRSTSLHSTLPTFSGPASGPSLYPSEGSILVHSGYCHFHYVFCRPRHVAASRRCLRALQEGKDQVRLRERPRSLQELRKRDA